MIPTAQIILSLGVAISLVIYSVGVAMNNSDLYIANDDPIAEDE